MNASISLWIDSYNDIFSDFDPRPYTARTISDDFISQVKRVSRESSDQVGVLKLLMPEGSYQQEHERDIRKRLEHYFANIHMQMHADLGRTRTKAISFFIIGIVLMLVASYISLFTDSGFFIKLLLNLFEPGGWFFFWTGLDLLTSTLSKKKDEARFYDRMRNTHVEFGTYK